MDRLLGWWHNRALQMLQAPGESASAVELHLYIEDLRAGYERDNLPTYDDIVASVDEAAKADDMIFVHQLRWVSAPEKILQTAVSDYYRAYAHTNKWYEDDLLGFDELPKFEERLRDEWERAFAFAVAKLAPNASDDDKKVIGLTLLQDTLDRVEPRIRERYREPFFTRGTHHRLADERSVGWHPDFQKKLEELLLDRPA
jgi:hypothetical protein